MRVWAGASEGAGEPVSIQQNNGDMFKSNAPVNVMPQGGGTSGDPGGIDSNIGPEGRDIDR